MLTTVYCRTDWGSNHIPGEERVLLLARNAKFLHLKYKFYLTSYAQLTAPVSTLQDFPSTFGFVRRSRYVCHDVRLNGLSGLNHPSNRETQEASRRVI